MVFAFARTGSNASVTNASQGPNGVIASFDETHSAMNFSAKIDALQLMLTDLRTRNEPIRHKAAFRGCQPEFHFRFRPGSHIEKWNLRMPST